MRRDATQKFELAESPLSLPTLTVLDRAFYNRDPQLVAKQLLGMLLVVGDDHSACAGRIVESEAYLAQGDSACHSARGRSPKNQSMFGPPGHAYVYAIHAKWCFNVVTEAEGVASAVLIRAIEPLCGIEPMIGRRGPVPPRDLTRGPARLCQALGIDKRFDGWDLTQRDQLWLASDSLRPLESSRVGQSARIGVTSAEELALRYFIRDDRWVSGRRTQSSTTDG